MQWQVKTRNAHIYRVFAIYPKEKNTAGNRVVTREVKTWKSRVNATIRRVR